MRPLRVVAALAALAVALTGCGAATEPPVTSDAIISYNATEPANALIPGHTTEVGGIKVIGALFRGLVEYDPRTAAPRNAVAESIETTDSRYYTVRLRPGWTFHDGTPVTATSFVAAWNYTAYSPNGLQGAGYLSGIEGFDQVNAQPPTATEMSGLRVVDERTFTITLAEPSSDFTVRLGFAAFFPLPASFFTDRAGFEAHPIGNGPFRFDSRTSGTNILVSRYDNFGGELKPHIGGIEFRFYESLDAAYADVLADRLDFLETAPGGVLAGNKYEADLPAHRRAFQDYLGLQAVAFPLYDQRYADPRLRQAISMAIDRVDMIEKVFQGRRRPADGLVPPNVQGRLADQCGQLCTYQPERARRLFEESGFQGPIELTSNTDSNNREWMEQVCASLTRTLGRDCRFVGVATLGELRRSLAEQSVRAIYRSAWVADYPSIENFLNPLYRTGGAANVGRYSNLAVDELLAAADAAPSAAEGYLLYQQAERLVLQDMPAIPIWFLNGLSVWSSRLQNVLPTQFRELDLYSVTVSGSG